MKIKDVLKGKPSDAVVTISPDATVRELVASLAEHNIGAVIVSTDGTTVAGIVSERDVVRRLVDGESVLDAAVSSLMTSALHTCSPSDEVDSLMTTMTEHRVRHIPVLDGERLMGVVSIGDVVKFRIDQLQFERDQLDQYVHQS